MVGGGLWHPGAQGFAGQGVMFFFGMLLEPPRRGMHFLFGIGFPGDVFVEAAHIPGEVIESLPVEGYLLCYPLQFRFNHGVSLWRLVFLNQIATTEQHVGRVSVA
ncbi:hypothetical protein D5085_02365 [Ectothiorhodospiraceae bacterium BW-2]|nr:hypothetical protein D5085_02365 [Ectothiorhodospiraceae bacterium BW-2]